MRGVKGQTTCHPERVHFALGLCQQCYQARPEGKAARRAWYWNNRAKILEGKKQYHARNRIEKNRATRVYMYRQYGFSILQYEEMLASQGGGCAICGVREPGRNHRYFSVDHDHRTGQIRGLLCINHNLLLGYAGDNVEILESAIKYLQGAR